MSDQPKPVFGVGMSVCDAFIYWAHEAVDDWDGQDTGDLLVFLSERMGMQLNEIVEAGKARVARESMEYNTDPKEAS